MITRTAVREQVKVAPRQPRYCSAESTQKSNHVLVSCFHILWRCHWIIDFDPFGCTRTMRSAVFSLLLLLLLLSLLFWGVCEQWTNERLGHSISVCQEYNELRGLFVWIHSPNPPSAAFSFWGESIFDSVFQLSHQTYRDVRSTACSMLWMEMPVQCWHVC